MGDQILMKMATAPDDPDLVNASFHGETLFMPVIRQCTPANAETFCAGRLSDVLAGYDRYSPVAYEMTLSSLDWLSEGVPAMEARNRRIWVNTLEPRHAAGLVDAQALSDPDAVWGELIDRGVDMIQTDTPAELIAYLATRN